MREAVTGEGRRGVRSSLVFEAERQRRRRPGRAFRLASRTDPLSSDATMASSWNNRTRSPPWPVPWRSQGLSSQSKNQETGEGHGRHRRARDVLSFLGLSSHAPLSRSLVGEYVKASYRKSCVCACEGRGKGDEEREKFPTTHLAASNGHGFEASFAGREEEEGGEREERVAQE